MSPKLKMYAIHLMVSFVIFFSYQMILMLFHAKFNIVLSLFVPLVFTFLISPRPNVTQMQSGKAYGLKFIFSDKIIKM